jgi:flagellar motor switch protein FliN/FliY
MKQTEEKNIQQPLPASPENVETVSAQPAAGVNAAASLLMGVKMPIRILLGRTELSLKDVAQLGNGSVVELDCSPNDPVEIIVNDQVIAHGEVVVVSGNYGVRITGIAGREDKARQTAEGIDLLKLSEGLK